MTPKRSRPLIASEDSETGDGLERPLGSLAFTVDRSHTSPDTAELPAGDVIVVCGPKSSPIADDWEAHNDPDGKQLPRSKRHDDKAIATLQLS
ncbi:hypothetical protein [Salinifilum ghardaiensis]